MSTQFACSMIANRPMGRLVRASRTPVAPRLATVRPLQHHATHLRPLRRAETMTVRSMSWGGDDEVNRFSDASRDNMKRTIFALRRAGFLNFWTQSILSCISGVILLFSVAFTPQDKNSITLYLTAMGLFASLIGSFWAYAYTRLARGIRRYMEYRDGKRTEEKKVTRRDVKRNVTGGIYINIFGAMCSLIGLQATTGLLVGKTLTSATVNPFIAGGSSSWNPVLALDVFLVQAAINVLMSHFVGLVVNLWLARMVGEESGIPTRGDTKPSNPVMPIA